MIDVDSTDVMVIVACLAIIGFTVTFIYWIDNYVVPCDGPGPILMNDRNQTYQEYTSFAYTWDHICTPIH